MDKDIDVFISYSRKDYINEKHLVIEGNVISSLKELFKSNGISFWIDEEGVYSGDAFAQVIARNIKRCKILLFVSSIHSNSSSWTSNEIATAVEYKKLIIPFRIDDSTYHEDVVLYVAKLDYIAYYANKEKSLQRLVEAILAYKDKLESQRQALLRQQEEVARMKREEEERIKQEQRQVQEQKEKERLAAIALEKKRREEELNTIVNQIFELDKAEGDLENKRDEAEREIKNIDREISLIHKQQQHLESRRKLLENQLSVKSPLQNKGRNDKLSENTEGSSLNPTEKLAESKNLAVADARFVPFSISLFHNHRLLFLGFAVILFILLMLLITIISRSVFVFSDNAIEEAESLPTTLQIVPVENDSVFGIESIDTIDWHNLYVNFPDEDVSLHKITFALLKATSGKNDAFANAKYNREKARGSGVKLAFYHLLNTKASWKYATGRRQAENYIKNIGQLDEDDLPPVLSIPQIEKEDADIAKARCLEWLSEVEKEYGLKPIVYVGQSIYEEYVRHWGLDNEIWMPTMALDVEGLQFQKLHYRKTILYNEYKPQDSKAKIGRLSKYIGSYRDFEEKYGLKQDIDSI